MPRTPDQNQARRDETQRRLLDAARRAFVRLGFERATIRDIADEAGVSQGLLYNYFRSKDDLLREVFHAGARDVAEALAAGNETGTPAEQLERVIRQSFAIVRERRDFWVLAYMLRFQPGTAALAGELAVWMESVRAKFERLLRKIGHRDARALSRVLFAAIDGIGQHYALSSEPYPLEATATSLVNHFCVAPGRMRSSRKA